MLQIVGKKDKDYKFNLLNIGYISNETNKDVCMYIEEFISYVEEFEVRCSTYCTLIEYELN